LGWGDKKKADKERGATNKTPIRDTLKKIPKVEKGLEIAGKLNPKQIKNAPSAIRSKMGRKQCPECGKGVSKEGEYHRKCAGKVKDQLKAWNREIQREEQERERLRRGAYHMGCGCNPTVNKFHGKNCRDGYGGIEFDITGR
jgi:hypothetical protein